MEIIYSHPAATHYLDASVPCVHTVWSSYPFTDKEFRDIVKAQFNALATHNVTSIFADARDMISISEQNQQYTIEIQFHVGVANGLKRFAILVDPDSLGKMSIEHIFGQVNETVTHRYFSSEKEAKDWLRNK